MSGRTNVELGGITLLGNQQTKYPDDYAPEVLETFPNKHPENGQKSKEKSRSRGDHPADIGSHCTVSGGRNRFFCRK